MKRILILLTVCLFLLTSCASPEVAPIKEVDIVGVFDVPGISKEQIYEGSMCWISENVKSAKDVIQYSSKEGARIISKGNILYPTTDLYGKLGYFLHQFGRGVGPYINFTMIEEIKEGKFRLIFKEIEGKSISHNTIQLNNKTREIVISILISFGDEISSYLKEKHLSDNNW